MGTVRRQSIQITIVSYIGAALGVVNKLFLLTNFLSTDKVGLFNVLVTVALIYTQLSAMGITTSGIRFFPYFQNREKKHHGFLFWGSALIMAGFFVVTALCLLCKPLIAHYYSKQAPMIVEYYNYLIPLAFAMLYFQFFDTYLRALLKTVVATLLGEVLGRLMVTVCISLFALQLISFHQFVDLYVLSNFLLTLLLIIYMIWLKQFHISPTHSPLFRRMFKAIMLYGIFTILSSLGGAILKSIDSLMVAGMLNLSKAGIYTTVALFPVIMVLPWRSLQRTTFPLVARFWKKKDMKSMISLYRKTTLANMIVGGFFLLIIWINLDFVFSFMPKVYAEGKYVFLFLAIAAYIDMATGLNGYILVMSKKYKYDLGFMLLLAALTIVANYLLIPPYGIIGSAIATAASIIIYNIIRLMFVQYLFKMQPFTKNCLWVLLITLSSWLISLLIPQAGNKYIDVILNSVILALSFGIPLLWLKLFPDLNKLAYGVTKWRFLLPKEENHTTAD